MAHRDIYKGHSFSTIKAAVIGGLFGGVIYIIFNFLFGIRFPDVSLLGIIISFIIGAILRVLYESYPADQAVKKDTSAEFPKQSILEDENVLELHEEQLDISKKRIQTAKVITHKEIVTEEKNIMVPVTREELVIEKTVFDPDNPNDVEGQTETIRIPISEEDIDIVKHKVELEDVSVYNNEYEENQQIKETLKKEKLNIKTTGKAKVIDNATEDTNKA